MIAMSDQLSVGESGDAIHAEARGNDFFLFDEEAPAKSDDDDSWDGDWEDDDY